MNNRRIELQDILEGICENVYFQPPENVQIKYPCIIYNLNTMDTQYADNDPYHIRKNYQITVIDKNPDSCIPDKVAKLSMCRFDRFYTADNLNHFVLSLYY